MKNILSVGKFFICLSFLLPLQIMAQQEYTTDLCNDGIASASSVRVHSTDFSAGKAFDDAIIDNTSAWQASNPPSVVNPEWIMYDFGEGNEKKITKYGMRAKAFSTGDDLYSCPKDWTFEASNDGLNWTVLGTVVGHTAWNIGNSSDKTPPKLYEFTITNNQAYRYYRIVITANRNNGPYVSIGEIEMMSNIEDITYTDYEDKRANIWYFGNNAGISFNTEPPTAITDGQLVAREGCATICDTSGNILFYTDGLTVWNKAHTIMENGTMLMDHNPSGAPHATQSGVITPSPQDSVYYVFSIPSVEYINLGTYNIYFRYATVDMRLNGGLGKVIEKNIQIGNESASERITAVAHANNRHIWVITHLHNKNTFYAYLITESGIDIANPVVSNLSADHARYNNQYNVGCLKSSPDGKKLAMAYWGDGSTYSRFELFDFDPATGIISNQYTLLEYSSPYFRISPYGVEFSPDGSKLYGSTLAKNKEIYQWDLNAGDNTQIKNSRTLIATASNNAGALQLAPDGRIYCALSKDGNTSLDRVGVIKFPNLKGKAAMYTDFGIDLKGKGSRQGFPNFVQSFLYRSAIKASSFCFGDSTQFSLSNTYMLSSVEWDFDDVASGHNTSTSFSPKHKFSSVGIYNVKLTRYYTDGTTDIVFHVVNINPIPIVDLGSDTILCTKPLTITLDAQNSGSSFLWNTGHTGQQLTVTNDTGTYIVNVVNEYSCLSSDTVRVDICSELLPITLYSFDAECKDDNNVLIKWQTASEINNDYFLLERAFNRNDFDKIATISGSGNSNTLVEYEYTDI
ncbi:MAG: hypothetical protein GX259_01060, partial [Bacteroidales bacterium]|nr:hypothetical protein [Bacteroidales bacterium]